MSTPGETASEVAAHTHVDDRLLELDVQPVVGRCDDCIFCSPHILGELSVQLGEGNLATAADKAMQTGCGATRGSGDEQNLWAAGWGPILFLTTYTRWLFTTAKTVKHLLSTQESRV